MRLALFGRDEGQLRAVAEAVRARGALVAAVLVDVRDQEAMRTAVSLVDDAHPLDLVIANAGVSGGSAGQEGTAARIFAVNLIGTAHTVEPLLPRFVQRRQGHLALMSSLASFLPSPHAAAYGARPQSASGARLWACGWRRKGCASA
jgi:NADP-dependent 3-hydroxy acid dehydrogenase YdfG